MGNTTLDALLDEQKKTNVILGMIGHELFTATYMLRKHHCFSLPEWENRYNDFKTLAGPSKDYYTDEI